LRNVKVEVVDLGFCCSDELGSELTVRREEMVHDGSNASRVLASGTVEKGTEVDGVNSVNNLSNECFLGGLAHLETLVAFDPNSSSCIELSCSAGYRRDIGTRIGWSDPRIGWL
jgi:hypothetical protein